MVGNGNSRNSVFIMSVLTAASDFFVIAFPLVSPSMHGINQQFRLF
jgi:hypothetical protein